ncbi:hypothetical protein F2Q70_00018787 [Brassica cretica]|uniref:Uncharacterized protein n=4 Tax=Brassica TaxID=3705 RepID=A0A8S9HTT7_BRACR|nr:hypothetical protein F2Q70_00018787 [Brassica cretica]KAG2284264.1 hypothetical protein Bca52824_055484 [Brassica carinata]CAF1921185.1 unnamed protein product [Brassica napus]CDY44263.1 BnaC02g41540D [Brassica napus]VDD27116.1 unnamed protein product [Brassica oleracea]
MRIIFECSVLEVKDVLSYPHRFPELQSLVSSIMLRLQSFESWSLCFILQEQKIIATEIAMSVIHGHRYHSYIAQHWPAWLQNHIDIEAANS